MVPPRMTQSLTVPLLLALTLLAEPARSNDGTWSRLSPASSPPARREYAGVYDAVNQRYLLFAGFTNVPSYTLLNEIWVLSLLPTPTWTQISIADPVPGERHSPQYGYDPVRNRVLVFGGYGSHHPGDPWEYLNDVWQLDLNRTPTWTELFPSGTAPVGRLAGAAVYDPLRQRFVGFGGTRGLPVDTWELDLSGDPAWDSMPTIGTSPPGSYGMTSIYDVVRDRMITFGGSTSDDYYGVHNDTWDLNLHGETPTWHQLSPAGPLPSARRSGTSIYDPLRDRMVIFGGWDSGDLVRDFLSDTWALSLVASPEWTQLAPAGTVPPGRDGTGAVYDPVGDQLLVFGGWSGEVMLNDTQALRWGIEGSSASVSASAAADPGVAPLQWRLTNVTGPYVGVYRRTAGSQWSSLGVAQADASGRVTFDDAGVTAGGSYGYLLTVSSQAGVEVHGESWVNVPGPTGVTPGAATAFALRGVQPNPAVDRCMVSFGLPTAEPARLELLDLAGRRVFSRQVGALGAGLHRVELSSRSLAPGVYFVSLTQSGRMAQSRVVFTSR